MRNCLRKCMGIEPLANFLENSTNLAHRSAQNDAPTTCEGPMDPGLVAVIDAWPALPEAIRAGILAMERAAGG